MGPKRSLIDRLDLNVVSECRELRWSIWQCPPFLFMIMGIVTILSMVMTYLLASRYIEEPEVAALVVIFIATLLLVFGNSIITGFNKIAEANRMKTEFISLISHQLRAPLSIFKWTLDLLERDIKAGSRGILSGSPPKNGPADQPRLATETELVETMRGTTEKMIRLVNSLLEVSRLEARTLTLKETLFSLEKLTASVLEGFKSYAAASKVKINFEHQPVVPQVKADWERIAMVIQNLLDNAIRYTPESGNVKISIVKVDDSLKWSIMDNGIGIPAEQQRLIFTKFFRATNSAGNRARGSGVGLYIAKGIVEASGGKIGFSSKEGGGSTFWFTLPLTK